MVRVLSTSAWPPRQHICLDCRTLLCAAGPCECGSEETVALDDEGRFALVDRVWGELDHRDPVNRPAAAMMLIGGLMLGFSVVALYGLGVIFGFGTLVTGGLFRVAGIGHDEEDRRGRMKALAASEPRRLFPTPRVFGGEVVTDVVCRAPMSYRYCVAYAIELRDELARDTYLRDAVTIGFEIEGNDGRTVVVPAGPVIIAGGSSRPIVFDEQIRPYLESCDPAWHPDRYDPFPYSTALEAIVCEGDIVEIHNDVIPANEPGKESDYRHSARARMQPVGIPRVRILGRA